MTNEIFNTVFENLLRILLLLKASSNAMNVDRVVALDFICIYGKKFGVSERNLHGDNEFGLSEFTSKRERISAAIRLGVRNNYINVESSVDGVLYSISDYGRIIADSLECPYSQAYMSTARDACMEFSTYQDEALLKFIHNRAIAETEV